MQLLGHQEILGRLEGLTGGFVLAEGQPGADQDGQGQSPRGDHPKHAGDSLADRRARSHPFDESG